MGNFQCFKGSYFLLKTWKKMSQSLVFLHLFRTNLIRGVKREGQFFGRGFRDLYFFHHILFLVFRLIARKSLIEKDVSFCYFEINWPFVNWELPFLSKLDFLYWRAMPRKVLILAVSSLEAHWLSYLGQINNWMTTFWQNLDASRFWAFCDSQMLIEELVWWEIHLKIYFLTPFFREYLAIFCSNSSGFNKATK